MEPPWRQRAVLPDAHRSAPDGSRNWIEQTVPGKRRTSKMAIGPRVQDVSTRLIVRFRGNTFSPHLVDYTCSALREFMSKSGLSAALLALFPAFLKAGSFDLPIKCEGKRKARHAANLGLSKNQQKLFCSTSVWVARISCNQLTAS